MNNFCIFVNNVRSLNILLSNQETLISINYKARFQKLRYLNVDTVSLVRISLYLSYASYDYDAQWIKTTRVSR